METATSKPKKKRSVKKTLVWIITGFFIISSIVAFYLYNNFNQLLSEALIKNFNTSFVSNVYELKFEKLQVNLLQGNIGIYNVLLQPREKPLHNYPYINSSLQLKAKNIQLTNVQISTLLQSNILELEKIEIIDPDIQLKLAGDHDVFFPFEDSTLVKNQAAKSEKRPIEAFKLEEFKLDNASFHSVNSAQQREFNVKQLNISLSGLLIDQHPGKDLISNKHVDLSIGEITGRLQKGAIRNINFKDYKMAIDSLHIENTSDTTIYDFTDFTTGLKTLDIQTADSLFHLTSQLFNLSYKDKSITMKDVIFKPNISEAAMQKKFKYSITQFSGSVGKMNITGLNFDSLIHSTKIFIDAIVLDKVSASIFKDQTIPIDKNHFPGYPGPQIAAIPIPLLIKQVKATNVTLVNTERKPDGGIGKVNIKRLTLAAKNITNLSSNKMLEVNADAYIENVAHVNLSLGFSYKLPQFSINGTVKEFNLPDLNSFLQTYAPASITKGTVDEISFSGNIYRSHSTGTMKFLYHDLHVNLALAEKAKWKSSVLSFAANTVLHSSNPVSSNKPPRIVQFNVERNMNKGFINILIKSIIDGIKETMIMSKENKKIYREAKKESRKEKRQNKKSNKN